MLDLQKFFNDFENLTIKLENRGLSKDNLLFIKEKIVKQRELTKKIN